VGGWLRFPFVRGTRRHSLVTFDVASAMIAGGSRRLTLDPDDALTTLDD
jgi:hypothetical protein